MSRHIKTRIMKKIILLLAVVALSVTITSCDKKYDCDCFSNSSSTWSTVTVKAKNVNEAAYTCSDKSSAPATSSNQATTCKLRGDW